MVVLPLVVVVVVLLLVLVLLAAGVLPVLVSAFHLRPLLEDVPERRVLELLRPPF